MQQIVARYIEGLKEVEMNYLVIIVSYELR